MSSAARSGALPRSEAQAWPRRAVIPAAVVFFALQVIATVVAIANKLPYEFGGHGDPNSVGQDFLMGGGTALSGPLYVLVILALFIIFGRRQDRWGMLALAGSAIVAGVATFAGSQEPIAMRMLQTSPFGLFEAVVVVLLWGSVLSSAAIAVLSLLLVAGRMRSRSSA